MLFEASDLDLPQFALRPEHLFHKIGQVMGYQDIDFDSHPEFSKRYLLRGADEEAVRRAFGSGVLSYFEQQTKISCEADRGQLIFYRPRKRVAAEEVDGFVKEGVQVLALLRG